MKQRIEIWKELHGYVREIRSLLYFLLWSDAYTTADVGQSVSICRIRDNLTISNPDLTDEKIIAVCEKVDLWSYIKTLPNELETQIGDSGIRLHLHWMKRTAR